jgi:catechol 2,3-dioxygenase-like lactoylglutathione lyase family enzyme
MLAMPYSLHRDACSGLGARPSTTGANSLLLYECQARMSHIPILRILEITICRRNYEYPKYFLQLVSFPQPESEEQQQASTPASLSTMLGHVSIRVSDLEASAQFYLEALSPLSYKAMRFPEVIGIGPSDSSAPIPCLWLRKYAPEPESNGPVKPSPVHISFYVPERRQVDEFHARGIKAGGKDNGPPGMRPFMANYYSM